MDEKGPEVFIKKLAQTLQQAIDNSKEGDESGKAKQGNTEGQTTKTEQAGKEKQESKEARKTGGVVKDIVYCKECIEVVDDSHEHNTEVIGWANDSEATD